MDVKPSKGLRVKVSAAREAVFGEDGVEVKRIAVQSGGKALGTMTGRTLIGYAEVEMSGLDGSKHWYPVEQLATEGGDRVVEEEIALDVPEEGAEGEEEEA